MKLCICRYLSLDLLSFLNLEIFYQIWNFFRRYVFYFFFLIPHATLIPSWIPIISMPNSLISSHRSLSLWFVCFPMFFVYFILANFIAMFSISLIFSSAVCDLLLILSSESFISDILFWISGSSVFNLFLLFSLWCFVFSFMYFIYLSFLF